MHLLKQCCGCNSIAKNNKKNRKRQKIKKDKKRKCTWWCSVLAVTALQKKVIKKANVPGDAVLEQAGVEHFSQNPVDEIKFSKTGEKMKNLKTFELIMWHCIALHLKSDSTSWYSSNTVVPF